MSEFEIASLDSRTATLAARRWANWIAGAALAVSALVGAAQCAIVAWGVREMVRGNRDRMRRAEARTRAADRRHTENMRRLDALIEGQAEQRRANAAQTRALEALLERSAAKPPTA